jgi:outer membrane lipoprotein LolB
VKPLSSFHGILFAALAAALLAGCVAMPPAGPSRLALEDFRLEGRFSLRQDGQNHAGRLSWRHTAKDDELLLASPFGQGLAEIVAAPGRATLTLSDGQTFTAPDVPSLTESALGYRLPLALLTDWIRGRSAGAEAVERDARGRPLRLRFEEWTIEYGYGDDDPAALPVRLSAERAGAFEIRLRVDEWNGLPDDEQ